MNTWQRQFARLSPTSRQELSIFHTTRCVDPVSPFTSRASGRQQFGRELGRLDESAPTSPAALRQGCRCLVLSRRRDHLTTLAALLPDADAMIMRGGTGAKALADIRTRIADTNPEDPLLVMTNVPYGGEGFDAPIIDTVFLVCPISYPGLVIQAVGRALRRHADKTDVIVHDYLDPNIPVLKAQYTRRRTAYRPMGFTD